MTTGVTVVTGAVERVMVALRNVRVDGGTQMRAALDEATVAEYVEHFRAHHAWGDFPPIVLFYDGSDYWVGDGFHRLAAYREVWGDTNPSNAVHAVVQPGTRRDAILYAAGANASHGLRRTNADKRRAVEVMLRDDEWAKWSDREIGRRCNVSAPMVADIRRTLTVNFYSDDASNERTYTTKHGTPATMQTANIGASRPAAAASSEGRYASGLPVLAMPGGNGHASGVTSHASAVATENAESTEIDAWVAALAAGGNVVEVGQRLAGVIEPWVLAWRDEAGRTWREVAGRTPWHANSPFRQELEREVERRGVQRSFTVGVQVAEAIRTVFRKLAMTEAGIEADEASLTVNQWREMQAAQAADNLLLSDGEAEESTADFADFAEEEGETLTGDDLQVMQAFPAWVSAGADGDGAPGRETDEPQMSEYLAYRDRAQQNGDAYLNHRDWCTWVKAGRPVVTAKLLAAGDEVTADDAEDTAGAEDAGTAAEGEAGREGEGEQAPVSQREGYDSDEWYTPGWVIEAARRVMGEIDLDPASCELAQEVVGAGLYWTKRQDGCRAAWWGRVWLNPPYSAPGGFVEKLIEEYTHGNVKQAVVLLNNSTETRWFQRLLMRFPVCFFNQRLAFWRHDHADVGARQGQAVFYLGPEVDRFVSEFGEFGIVVRRVD